MPSLGMMTINALVSSDSVLIPVQAAYLPVKGLQQLIKTILTVKKRLNRKLAIEGILLTMVDFRTNYARDIASRVHTTYGSQIEVFESIGGFDDDRHVKGRFDCLPNHNIILKMESRLNSYSYLQPPDQIIIQNSVQSHVIPCKLTFVTFNGSRFIANRGNFSPLLPI